MSHMSSGTGSRDKDVAGTSPVSNVPEGPCAGVGSSAIEGSVLQQGATRKTGVCPLCGERVRLGSDTRLLDHAPATTPG
jgi:hypothetical protein